jgi:hypothetical protein
MYKVVAFVCLSTVLAACSNDQDKSYNKVTGDPLLFSKTVKNLNDIVLENNFPPMVAARNYAYATIAAYECISAGDPAYKSLAGQIKHMPSMPKPEPGDIDFPMAHCTCFVKVGNAVTFPEGSMIIIMSIEPYGRQHWNACQHFK